MTIAENIGCLELNVIEEEKHGGPKDSCCSIKTECICTLKQCAYV